MLEPWNNKSILPPPLNTFLCESKKDIKDLKYTISNIIRILTNQSPLHKESAIFSRFLYKFDKKFRNDIGYRNFKKVNTSLKKYLVLNLLKDVEGFASVLPNADDDLYLPTRQMLQYVLVRVITFAKLMLRIVICSKQAAIFYLNRIKRGESHWMCLMPYALLSRIWSMTQVLLDHSCTWYNQLHAYLDLLQPKGLEFLPSNYKLPDDLIKWCDLKNLDDFVSFEWTKKIKIRIEPILPDDTDGNLCENILDYVKQINELEDNQEPDIAINIMKNKVTNEEESIFINNTDIGVALDRNSSVIPSSTPSVEKKNSIQDINLDDNENKNSEIITSVSLSENNDTVHSVTGVTNSTSLKLFINLEEDYRNEDNNKALTGHLSFMQWQTLKTSLLKLTEKEILPRKLQRKILRIWDDKCEYYK